MNQKPTNESKAFEPRRCVCGQSIKTTSTVCEDCEMSRAAAKRFRNDRTNSRRNFSWWEGRSA
jgi:hypothetical protein